MVDGEAAEDGEPGRAYAPEPARRFRLLYRTGSECIIADDAVASPTTKVRDAPPALLGAATQPVIQFRDAGVEFGQFVMIGKRCRCAEGHAIPRRIGRHGAFQTLIGLRGGIEPGIFGTDFGADREYGTQRPRVQTNTVRLRVGMKSE